MHGRQPMGRLLRTVALNPVIIGIVLALPNSILGFQLPKILIQSGEYFANMTLPLALLCTGAALNFRSWRQDPRDTLIATTGKLLLMPVASTLAAITLCFRGVDAGIVLLMSSASSAVSGYAMVRAMGGSAALAAHIVATTNIGSLIFTSGGIMILKGMGLM